MRAFKLVGPERAKRLLAADQLEVDVARVDGDRVEDDPTRHPVAVVAQEGVLGALGAREVAVVGQSVVHVAVWMGPPLRDALLVPERRGDLVGQCVDPDARGEAFEHGLERASLPWHGDAHRRCHCRVNENLH
jgi:ribosomal protein S18 acetylase RimI-like enzyme